MCCGAVLKETVVEDFGAVLHGPEIQEFRGDGVDGDRLFDSGRVGEIAETGLVIRNEGDVGDAEILAVAFVVGEEKELVFFDRTTEGGAVVVALELGDAGLVEVVAGVEEAVAKELVDVTVELVGAGGGDDGDLRAIALAVGSGVGVGDDVEFANAVDAEELAGGAAGSDVDERCAGVLDAVEEEEIVLGATARDGEHVANRGV